MQIFDFSLSAEQDMVLVNAIRAAAGCNADATSSPKVGVLAVHARLPSWTEADVRHGLVYLDALKRVSFDVKRQEVALIPLIEAAVYATGS